MDHDAAGAHQVGGFGGFQNVLDAVLTLFFLHAGKGDVIRRVQRKLDIPHLAAGLQLQYTFTIDTHPAAALVFVGIQAHLFQVFRDLRGGFIAHGGKAFAVPGRPYSYHSAFLLLRRW